MKILLLGAAGFIGTNLTIELAKNTKDEITLIDRNIDFFNPIINMNLNNVHIEEASLTVDMDFDSILKNQEIVYHLVSTTVPTTSNQHISQELVSNVIFSANLFEACIRCGVKKVVFISSGGTVYGREADCPLKEKTATNPISSYGIQKITIEKLLYLYRYMYGLDYRIIRLANPYGPCGIPIRISESISMAHSADKKTILKNILKPFSKLFATNFMANGEVCGRWQFGDKLFDEGKVRVFKTVINTEANKYNEELRNATREKYGVEDNIVIGHIGRLTEQKNTLFIIDIFNALVNKEPKAKLLIIGDGNLREAMIAKIDEYGIKDKVLYLGRREDIPQFYNAMDCFLLPSLYEGLPVVGVEAENCGLPMFFSTEIPKESSACDDLGVFISLEKSPDEWADEILQVVKKNIPIRKGKTEEVKAAGFDSSVEANELLKYYEGLIASMN